MSLTQAQRRAIVESDPDTGRLTARGSTCAALQRQGLAVQHGRTGQHYLSEVGRVVRERLVAASGREPPVPEGPAVGSVGFTAAMGEEVELAVRPGRRSDVAAAWQGLLEVRRVANDGDIGRPAVWEYRRMVHAVALALEAAGFEPSAVGADGRRLRDGYCVTEASQPDTVRVAWMGIEGLVAAGSEQVDAYGRALAERGWQATQHTDRSGPWFLLVSPKRR